MRMTTRMAIALAAAGLVTPLAPPAPAFAATTLRGQHWAAVGDQTGEGYGWAVSELADIDGDRAQDAIVSAPFHADGAGNLTGHADVLSGRTGQLVHRFSGQPGDVLGWAIADAGDIDNDGMHDVIAGAPAGFSACATPGSGPGRIVVYSGETGAELLSVSGEAADDRFGYAVGAAGDVDEDGHADLLVGAQCADNGGPDAGRVYVLSGADGSIVRTVDGLAGHHLGSGAGAAGDVDGDGRTDHVVGARDAYNGHGGALVLSGADGHVIHRLKGDRTNQEFGTFFVAGVGDVNGDGAADVYVADYAAGRHTRGAAYVFSGSTGDRLLTFTGERRNDGLGPGRSAGDVDGDARPELVIGSYNSSEGAPSAGKVQVFSGATGALLSEIVSTTAGEQLGFDAVGLGDVDGDGGVDLLLSAASGDTVYLVAA